MVLGFVHGAGYVGLVKALLLLCDIKRFIARSAGCFWIYYAWKIYAIAIRKGDKAARMGDLRCCIALLTWRRWVYRLDRAACSLDRGGI